MNSEKKDLPPTDTMDLEDGPYIALCFMCEENPVDPKGTIICERCMNGHTEDNNEHSNDTPEA